MLSAICYRQGETAANDVPLDQLHDAIDATSTLVWIQALEPREDELRQVIDVLGLNALLADDLRHGKQRTKLARYHDHVHVALHDCVLIERYVRTREIDVVVGNGWLLTVEQAPDGGGNDPQLPREEVRRRFELQRSAKVKEDEGYLLWSLLDIVVDRYFDVTDRMDDQLDDIEEIIFAAEIRDTIPREVFDLRRSLVHFRRLIAPLREVMAELVRREVEWLDPKAVIYLQDVYDHVLRIADVVESQRDLLTGLLEADLAVLSNRMNQVMKKMTSWGAILFVSTLIAGIYGMNFDHMPELDWQYGYAMALGAMAVVTLILYRYFKRRDWL